MGGRIWLKKTETWSSDSGAAKYCDRHGYSVILIGLQALTQTTKSHTTAVRNIQTILKKNSHLKLKLLMSVFSSHHDIFRQAWTSSGNKNKSKYLGSWFPCHVLWTEDKRTRLYIKDNNLRHFPVSISRMDVKYATKKLVSKTWILMNYCFLYTNRMS